MDLSELRPKALSFYFIPKLGVFSSVRAACACGQAIALSFLANQLTLAVSCVSTTGGPLGVEKPPVASPLRTPGGRALTSPCGWPPACVPSPEGCSSARHAHRRSVPGLLGTQPLHRPPPAADELGGQGHGQRRCVERPGRQPPGVPRAAPWVLVLTPLSPAESEETGVGDSCAGGLSVRERRRPRERRRGTGISFWTKDVSGRSAGTCPSTWPPSMLRLEAHLWPQGIDARKCLWDRKERELVWDS